MCYPQSKNNMFNERTRVQCCCTCVNLCIFPALQFAKLKFYKHFENFYKLFFILKCKTDQNNHSNFIYPWASQVRPFMCILISVSFATNSKELWENNQSPSFPVWWIEFTFYASQTEHRSESNGCLLSNKKAYLLKCLSHTRIKLK